MGLDSLSSPSTMTVKAAVSRIEMRRSRVPTKATAKMST
jgi:hypothetical protein